MKLLTLFALSLLFSSCAFNPADCAPPNQTTSEFTDLHIGQFIEDETSPRVGFSCPRWNETALYGTAANFSIGFSHYPTQPIPEGVIELYDAEEVLVELERKEFRYPDQYVTSTFMACPGLIETFYKPVEELPPGTYTLVYYEPEGAPKLGCSGERSSFNGVEAHVGQIQFQAEAE